MRIAVGLEYDGSRYAGWQSQPSVPSIQSVAQSAFSRIAAQSVSLICAGRTDAGVHALAQVAHFDTEARRTAHGWVLGANTYLPADVSVVWARRVPDHFHARYSAERRTYCYYILNRIGRSALASQRAALVHRPLDHLRMNEAAALLIGTHDFSAFRSSECQARSPVRRLEQVEVERIGIWLRVRVSANAFLHHMVRNIVGLLLAVGEGKQGPAWAREVLESRDRTRCAATAPAHGLYLWSVDYPSAFGLPVGGAEAASAIIPVPLPAAG